MRRRLGSVKEPINRSYTNNFVRTLSVNSCPLPIYGKRAGGIAPILRFLTALERPSQISAKIELLAVMAMILVPSKCSDLHLVVFTYVGPVSYLFVRALALDVALTRSPCLPPPKILFRHTHPAPALLNWAHYAATSAFSVNSLRRCCCMPTTHCNKSRDPLDVPEKLRIQRRLRPALRRLAH